MGNPFTIIEFADTLYNYTANSIKMNIRIDNWPFMNVSNSLHLQFHHVSNYFTTNEWCTVSDGLNKSALHWYMLVGSHKLYPLFLFLYIPVLYL